MYEGMCTGRGAVDTFCICICHHDNNAPCDVMHCAPVSASASDNVRLRHVNRNSDRGKRDTKRGARSLRRG